MPPTEIRRQQIRGELISEEIREIISYRPHWMIRKGNVILFAILLLMLSLTLTIKYPDVVTGSARLIAINAPTHAFAHKEGKLVAIKVSPNQRVAKGQPLAYIESTADYKEVERLRQWLQLRLASMLKSSFADFSDLAVPPLFNLGELQTAFQNVERDCKEHMQFFGSGYYQKKKAALQQDLAFNAKLKENIYQQERLFIQEKALHLIELAAYDSLAKERLVAPVELNKYKHGLLGKEQILVQTSGQLINSDVAAHNKGKEILELQKAVQDQKQKLIASLMALKSAIEAWSQQYIVTAPADGRLFFVAPLQLNEQVGNGQELFYVQPAATTYYAQVMAGQNGLGKVKEGQAVRLKAASYPSEEYGYLKGTIRSVSNFPNRRDSFLVQVDLPNGLSTVYGKNLLFRNNLSARAEIITDERTLFDRLFDPLRKLWWH